MIKFNDYHIFTGEIKEILSTFYLPKYRAGKWLKTDDSTYYWGKNLKNYTRRLQIKNNAYDSYTHEYLGWYLRFFRDYKGIDLMPLYNCFSDNECANLELTDVDFNSYDDAFKIYSFPIMLGRQYTIAIDSDKPVEICCAIYDKYQNPDQFGIPTASYKKLTAAYFNAPILYDTADIINNILGQAEDKDTAQKNIDTYEADIRMFIKVDINNASSIVVLEGDYRKWNDTFMRTRTQLTNEYNTAQVWETVSNHTITNFDNSEITFNQAWDWESKKDVNTDETYTIVPIDECCENFKPITPLQLLRINSGVFHPFADRLIEYLTGNVVTEDDNISDDIERIQQTISFANWTNNVNNTLSNFEFTQAGLWDSRIRPILYASMQIDRYNGNDKNHDILGYLDKDVETYYHTYEYITPSQLIAESERMEDMSNYIVKSSEGWILHYSEWPYAGDVYKVHTPSSEDIYPDLYKDSK